jgi:hypothetical protein
LGLLAWPRPPAPAGPGPEEKPGSLPSSFRPRTLPAPAGPGAEEKTRAEEKEEKRQDAAARPDPGDPRRHWAHQKGDFRVVERGTWEERSPDGKIYYYKEVVRTKDYVELAAITGDTTVRFRLFATRCDYIPRTMVKVPKVITFFTGKWVK